MILTRSDLQQLSRIRIREARLLLRNGHYDGAYYLTGLAVECALKACIARRTRRYDFPDKKVVNDSYDHNLTKLLGIAGLNPVLDRISDPIKTNWNVVKDWNVDSRYNRINELNARAIFSAASARHQGVLAWIRQHW